MVNRMNLNFIKVPFQGLELKRRVFFAFLLLYFSSSNWYTLIISSLKESSLIWASFGFDFLTAASILVASLLIQDRSKLKFLRFSSISSILLILLLLLANSPDLTVLFMSLLGIPAGFVSLALAALFVEETSIMERGRVSGAMVFLAILTGPAILILAKSFGTISTFAVLLILSLMILILSYVVHDLNQRQEKKQTYFNRFGKNYFLYFLAWILISFNNGFLSPTFTTYITSSQETTQYYFVSEYLSACIVALVGGFLMDWYGRKPILLTSVAFFGVATSLLALIRNPIISNLSFAASGAAWGIFLPTFYLFLWKEVSNRDAKPLSLSLGLMVFHLMRAFGFFASNYMSQFNPIELALISSSILFISAMPLIFAQEPLPMDELQTMRFTRYLRKIKEEVERQTP